MFGLGFAELVVLFVVLLLMVGPDKLPGVVRNIGYWMGRARKMVGDVQRDIEIEANRLDAIKKTVEEPMQDLQTAVQDFGQQTQKVINDVKHDVEDQQTATPSVAEPAAEPAASKPATVDPEGPVVPNTTSTTASKAASTAASTAAIDQPITQPN